MLVAVLKVEDTFAMFVAIFPIAIVLFAAALIVFDAFAMSVAIFPLAIVLLVALRRVEAAFAMSVAIFELSFVFGTIFIVFDGIILHLCLREW